MPIGLNAATILLIVYFCRFLRQSSVLQPKFPSSSQLQRKSHQRNTQLAHGIWYVELQCCIEAPMSSKGTSFWLLQARVEGSIWIGCVIRFHRFIISRGCAPGQTRALTVCVLFSAEVVRRGRRQKAMVVLPGWHACRCGESPSRTFTTHTADSRDFCWKLILPASLPGESQCLLPSSATRHEWLSEWVNLDKRSLLPCKVWKSKNEGRKFLALRVFGISQFALTDLARMAHYQWMYTSARPPGTRWGQCL